MNGIILVNKPKGFTSFDVIAKMRGVLKTRRLGHSGTLDPMATGVLPVFMNKATKACDILTVNEKSYIAKFELGKETDTQDITGTVVNTSDIKISKEDVLNKLDLFSGEIEQLPPMYSAVSVGGKRLYDLARQGIEVERDTRKITINKIDLLFFDEETRQGQLFISCSKGTYIRTIIHDLGISLGCGGIMTDLIRKSSNGFKLEQCYTIEQIQSLKDSDKIEEIIIPVDQVFNIYNKINLNEVQTKMYKNGIKLDIERVILPEATEKYRVYSNTNEFLGLALIRESTKELVIYKNFY